MPTPHPQNGDRRLLRTRCVLWHAPGAPAPANLVASLTARPVEVTSCDDPYTALASVCKDSHADPARPVLLVLIEPTVLALAARVLVLTEQLVPHAARWVYDSAAEVKLRAATPSLLANLQRTGTVPPPAIITRIAATSPVGAANGAHADVPGGVTTVNPSSGQAQKTPVPTPKIQIPASLGLTAEELAVLLADAYRIEGDAPSPSSGRPTPPPGVQR
jgi:hypothetical protein